MKLPHPSSKTYMRLLPWLLLIGVIGFSITQFIGNQTALQKKKEKEQQAQELKNEKEEIDRIAQEVVFMGLNQFGETEKKKQKTIFSQLEVGKFYSTQIEDLLRNKRLALMDVCITDVIDSTTEQGKAYFFTLKDCNHKSGNKLVYHVKGQKWMADEAAEDLKKYFHYHDYYPSPFLAIVGITHVKGVVDAGYTYKVYEAEGELLALEPRRYIEDSSK